jgi:hypothetical protein
MPTKITFIIDNPESPDEFERAYADVRRAAAAFPKLQRLESAKVWPKEDGTPTPAYRSLDLYFESYDDASAAVAAPAAADVIAGLARSRVTFTGLFSDID